MCDSDGLAPHQGKGVGKSCDLRHHVLCQSSSEAAMVVQRVVAEMAKKGYAEKDVFAVRLALEEAIANAIQHGHGGREGKPVRVSCWANRESILVEVEDQGAGFHAGDVPDPLCPSNLAKPSGRGLLLMRHFMTWVRFNERGNCVTMCRQRSVEESAASDEDLTRARDT